MKLLKFIPAILSICLIVGIYLGFHLDLKIPLILGVLVITFLLFTLSYYMANRSYTRNIHFNISTYILFFVIGIALITLHKDKNHKNHYSNFIGNEQKVVLVIKRTLKPNRFYNKYEASVKQLNDQKVKGKVLLNIKKDSINELLDVDNKIVVFSEFENINPPKNPYQFDYGDFLKKQQIYHQLTVEKNDFIHLTSAYRSLNGMAANFRKKINHALVSYNFKDDELAIINALLLGQRQDISKELLTSYQNAGAIHILAVSGLHIGILLLLLNALFKPLEKLKKGAVIKLVIIVSLLWIYAIIAGLTPSVVRAVSMFTAIAFGLFYKKRSSTLNNLFISLFVLLLINPFYIFSVGFQLSYIAVFSIVYFYPKFTEWFHPKNFFLKRAWQLFAISCSAQIGVLPLSLFYFHQFPSLFFISSLVIIPVLGFILGLGILVIGLALVNKLPQFLATVFNDIISTMNEFIHFIAKQEAFLFKEISFSLSLLMASYLFIVLCFRWIDQKNTRRLSYVLISVVFIQSIVIFEKWHLKNHNEFVIFNKSRYTVIGTKKGSDLTIYHDLDTITDLTIVSDYKIGTGYVKTTYEKHSKNIFLVGQKKLLLIDDLSVQNVPNFYPDIILLTRSPKINLERLIERSKLQMIIADASNYKSDVAFWKKTCAKYHVDFHSTFEHGAFKIND